MIYKKAKFLAVASIFISLLIVGCKSEGDKSKGKKGGKRPPTAVEAFIAKTQDITSTVNASGTLLSNEEVEIKPELQARVIEINFSEGAKVSKGQLLVKLDDADIVAQLKKVRAQKQLIKKNVERLEQLLKIDGVSKQEYDAAQTQLTTYDADIEALETQLRKTEIRAPFSGTIGLTDISLGAFITPQDIISTLQQTDPLKVDFSIPEKYTLLLTNEKELQFTIDGLQDTFTAKVYAKEPKVDPMTRSVKVRGRCENKDGVLVPGMFANVQLGIQSRKDAVMVPTEALIPVARGKNIAINRGGKVSIVPVKTGLRNEDLVEIMKGVQAGDTIITTGLMQIRPNSEVKLTKIEK